MRRSFFSNIAAILSMARDPRDLVSRVNQIGGKSMLFPLIFRSCRARRQGAYAILRIAGNIVLLLAAFTVVLNASDDAPAEELVMPHVITEQTTTRGRVVLLEEGRSGRRAVEGLRVQMWLFDEDQMIYETRTEQDGFFDLPRFELGFYRLLVGRMRLIVEIVEPKPVPLGYMQAPKVLFILVSAEVL